MGVGLFVSVWVARYLGPEQFGILNYAIAFVALFTAFSTLGLNSIIVRDIVNDPDSANEILGSAFALKLIGGVVALALIIATISIIRPDDNLTRWLVGIIAVGMVFQAFDAIDFWFQSQILSKYTVYAKSPAFLLANIGKVVLILTGATLIAFAWIALAEIAMGAVGLIIAYQMRGHALLRWRGRLTRTIGFIKDSWPLMFSAMVGMIYMRIDQIMLGEMVGDSAVGVYSAAVRLSEVWYFIPTAIAVSVFPALIEAKKISERLYNEHFQKLYNLMTWIAISIALPVTFLAGYIIDFLYGEKYGAAGTVLAIHIWAGIFVFLGVVSSKYLLTENYIRISFFRTSIGAVVNILLNLALIPRYGVNGAAITTLISYFLAVFSIVFIKKTRQQSLMMFRSLLLMPIRK
jgi:PST family polysaccharide transporter